MLDMPPDVDRAGHLVATRRASQGKRLLLIDYLNTVFERGDPALLWVPKGDVVRGRGVTDMRGGDVILIEAARTRLQPCNIFVMATALCRITLRARSPKRNSLRVATSQLPG